MKLRVFKAVAQTLLLTTPISAGFCQTTSELKNFLSQRIGLSQDQIAAVRNGRAFVKTVEPRSPAEIFVFGAIYVNAAPESYIKFRSDFNRLSHIEYLSTRKFSDPPQLSDLQGFGFDSDDVKGLKDCKPGDCKVQIPVSSAMDELRKSVNWAAPNVDEQVNQLVQKLALSRVLQYQKDGDRIFGVVYNDKGQQVNVSDQFKYILSYHQVLPRDLPSFYSYLLGYPNAKPANVEDTFYWENVKIGPKPTLRIVHVLTMRGDKTDQPPYVIAEKQLYSSHYFETALELTFLLRDNDDPKQTGFYLVRTMGCEQALWTGIKGAIIRRTETKDAVSDLEKSLTSTKDVLEHQK